VVAALLAALVVAALATSLSPPAPASLEVLVARTALAPGARVHADDVTLEARPSSGLTADAATAADLDSVVGRLVASPVLAGEVLRERDVLGDPLLAALGPGLVAVPVRLDDEEVASLLRPGEVVDLVAAHVDTASGTTTAQVVAPRARVLVVPLAGAPASGLGTSGSTVGSSTVGGSLVVVAITPGAALELERARVSGRLGVVWRSGGGRSG
jgi:Flp pilus assembly protein CpaB